jgi:hypothetical protein
MIGDLWGDVATIVTHPEDDVNAIVHVKVDDVIDAIQGAPIVGGLAPDIRDFVHGPLRDFAKSEIGAMVLTGVTMSLAAAVPFVGPQLEFLAFATPGFIAGGSFGPAWVTGYAQYIKKGVKWLSQNNVDLSLPDLELPPDVAENISDFTGKLTAAVQTALDYLHTLAPDVLSSLTYDGLAKALGIRYDAAVWALANARGNANELAAVAAMNFDPATGQPVTAAYAAKLANGTALLTSVPVGGSRLAPLLWTPIPMRPKATLSGGSRLAGRILATQPGADSATAAAVANAVISTTSPPPVDSTTYIVGGAVVLAAAGFAAWWFKWRRR